MTVLARPALKALPAGWAGKQALEIYNTPGNKVGSWPLPPGSNIIDASALADGIYFDRAGNSVKKIVIQR